MDQWIREQYKSKGGFGTKTIESCRNATVKNRNEQRNTLLRKFRNIPETMSPLMSPMVPKAEKEAVPKIATVDAQSRRLNMLKKWKEEKEKKKLEAKKKAKPVFKVFHVERTENLVDVYRNIKGKTINLKGKVAMTPSIRNIASENKTLASRTLKEQNTTENSNRLARSHNKSEKNVTISKPNSARLKFKAEPEKKQESTNKKPSNSSLSKELKKTKSPEKDITENKEQQITTRSQRKNKNEPKIKDKENLKEINIDSSLEKNNKKTPNRNRRKERIDQEEILPSKNSNKKKKHDESLSQKLPKDSRKSSRSDFSSVGSELVDDVFGTPKKSSVDDICYVSPFVTVSRGKAAARKEFEQRKSLNGSIFNTSMSSATDPRSPKAAAAYFTRMLNNEIDRIQDLCKIWQSYKDEGDISEDACGLIDMTIGQSNLLISKKFNQFRGLIEKCSSNDEVDMKIQCEDLHGFWDMIYKQVTDLDRRFDNLEDMKRNNWLEKAPKVKTPKKVVKQKKKGRSKSTKASSGLKETILAARKYRMKQVQSEGDVDILIVGTNRTPRRISRNVKEGGTPGKGILKSANVKSEKKKSVAFHSLMENLSGNKGNSSNISKGTPIPTRRSERLSLNRSKLVFDD